MNPSAKEASFPGEKEHVLPASVLLVDDDAKNLLALESIFAEVDYTLVKARTGEEALRALMTGEFAVIVLDVQMPDISGIELARLIKQRRSTQHIPIIFLTAHYREDEHAVLGYDVGAVDYLTKPLNPAVLRSKVNVFVELFRKTHALAALNNSLEAEIAERRTAEERFRVVFEAAPSAIIVFDEAGAIRLVNSQTEETFRSSRADLMRRNIYDLITNDGVPVTTGATVKQAQRADGMQFPAEVDCRPIQSSEGPLFLASILDITEKKQAEEALRAKAEAESANEAKDRFLAMLSHELRTPLTPIVYAVALLENDQDCPPHIKEAIATIQRNVWLEARLIDDLLDLARIRNGKLTLEVQAVEAHNVLREAVKTGLPEVEKKHIQLTEHFDAAQTQLQGDAIRLRQVFWNLLANAVKFTPKDGTIAISTSNSRDGRSICVEFTDNGVGIDQNKLGSIFDAFEQATQNGTAGLGLGLSICKVLVELHGGTIEARSEGPGKGSTFVVTLPCTKRASSTKETKKPHEPKVNALRILVVEDHEDTAASLSILLNADGHEVRIANSVAQAMKAASDFSFDVLMSDIGLPDGRGTELLKKLRAETNRPIHAIAMTGFGMEDDLEQSRLAGFTAHLTKPVEFATLRQAIARVATVS